ncbi:hypothetical protein, partial [Streptomyces sp. NPDC002671]
EDASVVPAAGPVPGPVFPVVQRQAEDVQSSSDSPAPSAAVQRAGSRPPLGASPVEDASVVPAAGPVPGPVFPVVQRQAEDVQSSSDSPAPSAAVQRAGSRPTLGAPPVEGAQSSSDSRAPSAPVQRTGSRPPLGAPLAELPSTAAPLVKDAPATPVSGPVLPVVQRQAEDTQGAPSGPAPGPSSGPQRSGARARGGLGAPLPAMPASAGLPGSAASGARASRTASGPDIQRTPASPAPGGDRTPPTEPASDTARHAPLLGTVDVQRHLADHPAPQGGSPTDHGTGPATPLVTPSQGAASQAPAGTVVRPEAMHPGPGPGDGRPQSPSSPAPVVVARRAAEAMAGARPATASTGGPRPATPAIPVARRTLALLPARPLTLNTLAPEGLAPSAASRPVGGPPVVAARWSGAPDIPGGGTPAPSTRSPAHPAHPASAPSAGAAATPPAQRAVTAHAPHHPGVPATGSAVRATGAPGVVQRVVPLVKPAPPSGGVPGTAAVPPVRPLPVTPPLTPPLANGPSTAVAQAAAIPVVRPRVVTPGARSASGGGNSPAVPEVQRAISGTGNAVPDVPGVSKGVPAKAVPAARGKQQYSGTASASASGRRTERSADAAQDPGLDLDDLARRLLDPMARLLRTELRRGRERTGRPYDGRR